MTTVSKKTLSDSYNDASLSLSMLTRQFADKPTCGQSIHRLYKTTCRLDNLYIFTTDELTSPLTLYSRSWPVRQLIDCKFVCQKIVRHPFDIPHTGVHDADTKIPIVTEEIALKSWDKKRTQDDK